MYIEHACTFLHKKDEPMNLEMNQGMYKLLYINIDYLEMNQSMYKLLYINIDYQEMNQGMYKL